MKIMNSNLDFVLSGGWLLIVLVCELVYLFVICWYIWEYGNVRTTVPIFLQQQNLFTAYIHVSIQAMLDYCTTISATAEFVYSLSMCLYRPCLTTIPTFLQQQNLFTNKAFFIIR